jgi:hypothetical protein
MWTNSISADHIIRTYMIMWITITKLSRYMRPIASPASVKFFVTFSDMIPSHIGDTKSERKNLKNLNLKKNYEKKQALF